MTDPYSRQRLAGYDPERLHGARVLVAGAGSLAQPLAETLVLSGVGDVRIADLDRFEPHNRAKSSHYPHHLRDAEADELPYKAEWVATSLARQATAPGGVVRYANAWIEELGVAAFSDVDVVVSCVDAIAARRWIASKALEFDRLLVTGGFSGGEIWYEVYPAIAPAQERPCWNCDKTPDGDVFSCRHYAVRAAEEQIIPAIQAGAVALAGFMAEAAIRALHDEEPAARGVALDLRTGESIVSRLLPDPECAIRHRLVHVDTAVPVHPGTGTFADLGEHVDGDVRAVELETPFVHTAACRNCMRTAKVEAPQWAWAAQPRCFPCGGRWARTDDEPLKSPPVTTPQVRPGDPLWTLAMAKVGIAPGDVLALRTSSGLQTVRVAGSSDERWTCATP